MNRNICIYEPTEIRLRDGWNDDYYCPECKSYVGYFSRLIWRKSR